MVEKMKLRGKVAIVTGAGRGIGRAIALALAREGASVIVNDIDLQAAEATAKEISSIGQQAIAVKADVTNSKEVNDMVKIALNKFGKIDILVNNAGGTAKKEASEFRNSKEETWRRVIDLNLIGTMICTRAVINHMIERKYGKIINISSECGKVGMWGLVDYSAAKAGVLGFTMALAREVGEYGINVNSVCPGRIKNGAGEGIPYIEEIDRRAVRFSRPPDAEPEEVASLVVYLASDESRYIMGTAISIDGGYAIGA